MDARAPVTLIPAQPQTLWRMPAVANFACGALGAGFYVAAAAASTFHASPLLRLASWLGPALVFAGFAAVATEAGRPLRGPRVAARVATSWMSREVWIGAAFAALAALEFVAPAGAARLGAAVVAAALVLAQGFILRRARGVAAWDVAAMPLVFLASSLLSGMGLTLLVAVGLGRPPGRVTLGATLLLLVLAALVWLAYLTWSSEPAFVDAVRPLREGGAAVGIVAGGYVAPFALVALGLALPALASAGAALAGVLMIAVQVRAKALTILTAGQLRPITVAHLRLHRRLS